MAGECFTCGIILIFIDAGTNNAERIYDFLTKPTMQIASSFAAIVFVGGFALRTQFGLAQSMGFQAHEDLFGGMFRVGLAVGALATFPFWRDFVVGNIDQLQLFITTAVLTSQDFAPPTGIRSELIGLARIEHVIFNPLERTYEGVTAMGFTSSLKNIHIVAGIGLAWVIGMLSMVLVAVMYIEFFFWKYLVIAMGPLIIGAWIFPMLRPGAWAAMKIFFQAVLTLILIAAAVSFIDAVYEPIRELAPPEVGGSVGVTPEIIEGILGKLIMVEAVVFFLFILFKGVAILIVFGGVPGLSKLGVARPGR